MPHVPLTKSRLDSIVLVMNPVELELQRVVDLIIRTISPKRIVLFGSRAKGCERTDSDFDIFCITDKKENTRDLEKRIYIELTRSGIGLAVDLIVEDEEIYNRNKNNPYLVFFEINRFGKTLYEKKTAA